MGQAVSEDKIINIIYSGKCKIQDRAKKMNLYSFLEREHHNSSLLNDHNLSSYKQVETVTIAAHMQLRLCNLAKIILLKINNPSNLNKLHLKSTQITFPLTTNNKYYYLLIVVQYYNWNQEVLVVI